MDNLVARVLANEPRAVGRAMRMVDDRAPGYAGVLKALWPHTGRAWVVGITGSPGAGKSTLCDRLIEAYRTRGSRVGVVAVDPSSPYTGGAILGDRIRMTRHATDPGVFIRSLATRGHLGGLSRSARDVVRVLDAAGHDVILIETVGVGQDELEVTRTAHSTLVVVAPGMGDDVQAIKAGILECADVFAVNKADRDGADAAVRDLELVMALGSEAMGSRKGDRGHWAHGPRTGPASLIRPDEPQADAAHSPPIVKCVATRGDGIGELAAALDRHRRWIEGTAAGRERRRGRLAEEVRGMLREALIDAAVDDLGERIDAAVRNMESHAVDPYTAIEQLLVAFRTTLVVAEPGI